MSLQWLTKQILCIRISCVNVFFLIAISLGGPIGNMLACHAVNPSSSRGDWNTVTRKITQMVAPCICSYPSGLLQTLEMLIIGYLPSFGQNNGSSVSIVEYMIVLAWPWTVCVYVNLAT